MGVNVNGLQFDTVNLMKDLKIARHALDKEKCALQLDPSEPCVAEVVDKGVVPLLQWLDNDSEPESFTLVQSKKKKKVSVGQGDSLISTPLRRSKRIVPSKYRDRGAREILVYPRRRWLKQKEKNERPILELQRSGEERISTLC
jgi:hypothetical protein